MKSILTNIKVSSIRRAFFVCVYVLRISVYLYVRTSDSDITVNIALYACAIYYTICLSHAAKYKKCHVVKIAEAYTLHRATPFVLQSIRWMDCMNFCRDFFRL